MSHIIVKSDNKYSLSDANKVMVARFETYYMKHSIAQRGLHFLERPVSTRGREDLQLNLVCFKMARRTN